MPCNVVHPRQAIQLQVERGLGGVGRTVYVEQDLPARELLYRPRMLVAHVEPDARVHRGYREFFHDELSASRGICVSAPKRQQRRREHTEYRFHFSSSIG